jgi:phosphate transport system permease protein
MASIDYGGPLTPSGNLRRRRVVDRVARGSATAAAFVAVAILVIFIFSIVQRGASAISLSFLTHNPLETFSLSPTAPVGGIANAIVGSALIVAVGALIALPLGVLIALFLTEFATPRLAAPVRLALDLLYGLPSIVIALFLYGLLVVNHGQAGVYASFALAIIMVPLIARTTSESLQLVPKELRDASHALGISRWRTTVGLTIPSALGGIVTGTVLAVARAAGETAPVLLLSSLADPITTSTSVFRLPLNNLPLDIYNFSVEGGSVNFAKAWGAALVLVTFVLVANFAARALHARSRRMMSR